MPISDLYARYRDFELLIDSRRLTRPERTLFFALPGSRRDGHDFIPALLERGIRHFVVSSDWWETSRAANFRESSDTFFHPAESTVLDTLQSLAAHHRSQFDIPVVGITGSNGKTIVKDWLVSLLEQRYVVCASPRSYNSQIGVPLSVWQLRPEHEVAIFEAGISERGEMEKLAEIIRPTHGVFTNLGAAHAAGFTDREQKLREKLGLFHGADWTLFPADEKEVLATARELALKTKTWRHDRSVDYAFMAPQQGDNLRCEDLDFLLRGQLAPMPRVFRRNAMTALAAAHLLGLQKGQLISGARRLRPLESRLEVRAGRHGCTIVNDTYSNDPDSLAAALDFAKRHGDHPRLTVILSDVPPGSWSMPDPYRYLAGLLEGRIDRLIGVGKEISRIASYLPNLDTDFFSDTEALLVALPGLDFHDETILVKGARTFALEQLIPLLTQRRHRTVLEVDLAALAQNFNVYRTSIRSEVKIAVMVKAAAYGSGSIAVARLLEARQADYLVVAYADEGVRLRESRIELPIMVLNPEVEESDRLLAYRLEPVIGDLDALRSLMASEAGRRLPLHLEFDTGMRRLGFATDQANEVVELLTFAGLVRLRSVFTHLAASEAEKHDDFTLRQLAEFDKLVATLKQAGVEIGLLHALNTNGVSRFRKAQYDMVRLGIGLYGYGDESKNHLLQPALRLRSQITAVRELRAGETIGYGRGGIMKKDGRIGVVGMGYADGLPRSVGMGRYALLVEGEPVPIVGQVCMDMCMVDLTELPEVEVGGEVVIFGPEHSLGRLATAAGTIPYEILTGIGSRVHRVYVGE